MAGLRPATTSAGIAKAPANGSSERIHFEDITQKAGINFTHYTGAFGKKYLPETMGPGCAFIDYDNDGCLDILLINGKDFPGVFRQNQIKSRNRVGRQPQLHFTSERALSGEIQWGTV